MQETTHKNGLSPLDQIRQAEAEIARKIIAAREASIRNAETASVQGAQLKKQAEEKGKRDGQIRCKETIAAAEEESKLILAQAQEEADALRKHGHAQIKQAVAEALAVVLGNKGG